MIKPFRKLSKQEEFQAALPILVLARESVIVGGEPIDSIAKAGMGAIGCWYARQLLLKFVPKATLQQWWLDPGVRQSDRTRAFDRAIRLARKAFGHKGGWVIADVGGAT